MSQELRWAVVVTLEESRKGKEEQFETVVPCKWLSRDEKWLWWPPFLQVKSKVHCDPDVTTGKKFKVLKIKIRGMQTHFVKAWCADRLNSPFYREPQYISSSPIFIFFPNPFLLTFFDDIVSMKLKKMKLRKFHWNLREALISSCLEGFKISLQHTFFFCKKDFDKQH